ncbi:MAG TPA: hypothetical protein VLI43_14755 [Gemmatimonadaceae bacterium]|nr:hypothetical protein [Gemmatimonadaceae bacterium]
MMLMRYVHTLYALAAVSTWHPSALRAIAPTSDADSASTVLILQELRGYYRDLHDRNWTSIVTHFYPAKVTARFAAPDGDRAWASLPLPAIEPHESPDAHGYCMPNTAIAIVGHWARVRARRCTGEADEAWLYSMSGRWKIIHLESGASLTMSRESRQSHRPTSRAVP